MLEVKNLTKQFYKTTAVRDASFSVKSGEIFVLIGPNGSGKTTIIKTIAGLLKPTSGEVIVSGLDTVKKPAKAKAKTGYIPDEPSIWSRMTGEEFLHFSGALYNISEKEREQKIPELLKIFNLAEVEKNYFEDYSRGNKQKFTILAALLHSPKLLLIDEPIVGLDPTSAETAKEKFREFAKAGGTVLVVTHTLSVAQKIADRIGVLKKGELVATGSFNELKRRAKLGDDASLEDIYKALT